jgi:hypothetical protein
MLKKSTTILAGSAIALAGVVGIAGTAFAGTTATHHAGLHHGKHRALRAAVISISAETIGITPQTLVHDLHSGESIAQVATANNVSPTTVETALETAATSRVHSAEALGTISSARGTKILASLPSRVDSLVNHVF